MAVGTCLDALFGWKRSEACEPVIAEGRQATRSQITAYMLTS